MSQEKDLKGIQSSVMTFTNGDLSTNALSFFSKLGYNIDRQNPFSEKTYEFFKESYESKMEKFNEKKALRDEWNYVDLLFQLSGEEITKQTSLFDVKKVVTSGDSKVAMESYLFFAIGLSGSRYTRTTLSLITREINKLFPMPAMVLFKYGQSLTLAVINRRLHKRDERKDVLEKVTLIKDINIENPHRAHIDILFDLSFGRLKEKPGFTNFVELHNAWQKTLDTEKLNKRFYQELANWYFWAKKHVSFPDDVEKNEDIRNATSLIRLITRIIFIWFIKEKDLVPEALFDRTELNRILKEFAKNEKSNSYYQAVLQNLFFGTLNQKMEERGFVKEDSFQGKNPHYGVKTLFRYANHFAIGEKEALALFKDIPFLNGGLFDCLDKENEEGKVLYSDGFSRNSKKQAIVPDFLFFGAEEEYDLNAVFGTKNKRYKVKGLIDILSGYKFTVAENTPVEEEVALDPELLGKVFENLLASYNPETQTTARKQTGSFYTPREIVNYMVDESLKAYLKQALSDKLSIKAEDADTGLEILFSYTEREHAFTNDETKVLIQAIDTCKILDPACGSGAFPMGILHKLVHILHKLDPKNEQWKERQIHKARQIDDPSIRDHLIADIESAFEYNELDYGRKLYLIENCIYGVDIQAIAGQIAKLRFFISLVVDQIKQPGKENLGIRSLPNLETKFVAANTLIGLEKPEKQMNLFENKEIMVLEDKLKELRHRYFSAKTRKEKMACQKEDKTLRQKIAKLLEKDGWEHKTAEQIVAFDPYDQNASSPFFDMEWMFGIKGGFDVVIGNPPYITYKGKEKVDVTYDEVKLLIRSFPNSAEYKVNSYALFTEKGVRILNKNGTLSYIIPSTILQNEYLKKIRKYLLTKFQISQIVTFGNKVFEAVTDSIIINANNSHSNLTTIAIRKNDLDFSYFDEFKTYNSAIWDNEDNDYIINLKTNESEDILLDKIDFNSDFVDDYLEVYVGIVANGIKKFLSDRKQNSNYKKYLQGKHINKYALYPEKLFINFIKEKLHSNTDEFVYQQKEKILVRKTGNKLIAVLDNEKFYTDQSIYNLYPKKGKTVNLNVVTGLLNSCLLDYYFNKKMITNPDVFPYIKGIHLKKLPLKFPKGKSEIETFSNCVSYVHFLKKEAINILSFFERLIDSMVYELYLPDEIKAAGCEVLKHLTHLPELKDGWSNEQKQQTIEKVYQELSDPGHPVSMAMEKMKTVPEVRIIEGLDK